MTQTLTDRARERPDTASLDGPGRKRKPLRRQEAAAHVFMAPWLLGLVLVTAVPMLASLYLSFTNYNVLSSPTFIGGDNYARLIEDPRFWNSVEVTLTYVVVS